MSLIDLVEELLFRAVDTIADFVRFARPNTEHTTGRLGEKLASFSKRRSTYGTIIRFQEFIPIPLCNKGNLPLKQCAPSFPSTRAFVRTTEWHFFVSPYHV